MLYQGNVTSWKQWLELKKQGYDSVSGYFSRYGNNLTSLEGAPHTVGGNFYCSDNNLTSLEGAPHTVGGNFYCHDNNLTSLEGAPKQNWDMFKAFYDKGYIFLDGIMTQRVTERTKDGTTIYKTKKLVRGEIVYVARNADNIAAHGKTAKEALEELAFKTASRDTKQYSDMPLDTKHTPTQWAFIYRAVTGACKYGTEQFIASKGALKKHYTLQEILEQTEGAFGYDKFKQVVVG